jgi:hypothetical protein
MQNLLGGLYKTFVMNVFYFYNLQNLYSLGEHEKNYDYI